MTGKWSLRESEESTEEEVRDESKEGETIAKSRTLPKQCVGESGRTVERLNSETREEKEEELGSRGRFI